MYTDYLTEQKLGECLKVLFPNNGFIHDSYVNLNGLKTRPDYRSLTLKLVVEFNGYRHYNDFRTIRRDFIKKLEYQKLGYSMIEIPYFVQLTPETIEYYFKDFDYNKNHNIDSKFPHGFIDKKAMLPCDFNALGLERFIAEMNDLPTNVMQAIVTSEKIRMDEINPKHNL